MTDGLETLREDFIEFRNECMELRHLFNTWVSLYDDGDESRELLEKTACIFFGDLNGWLIELIILKVARIAEPAGRPKKLTAPYIVRGLKRHGTVPEDVDRLLKELEKYKNLLEQARNRYVAHFNLEASRSRQALGRHTREDAVAFFENLNVFTDLVGEALGVGALDYRSQPGDGDVVSFINRLERAEWCMEKHADDRP